MQKFFVILAMICLPFSISAQSSERAYWWVLEQGKTFFRNGAYGQALIAFEDARRGRKAMFEQMEQDLITVLSMQDVRRMRDSLDDVEKYIIENRLDKASLALKELYYRTPRDSLGGSANNALKAIGALKSYPEAEYWLGEIYRVEGELTIALKQYRKAHEQRANLENPAFDVDILYKIVDILRTKREYTEMENIFEEIIALDTLWQSGTLARSSMLRVLETDGISRFLAIYRYDNINVEKIHRTAGFFYYASGRHSNALEHLIFSFLIQNTVIINEIIRNNYGFTFTDMTSLFHAAKSNPAIADYMERVEYYKTVYYLGAAFYAVGKTAAARNFWLVLRDVPEANQWAVRSASQLQYPFIEKAVEMP
jgi:tetratricopeptide (TPR) repeat protein